MPKKSFSGSEKRRAERRPILDSFSIFAVVPKKGDIRLPIHDLSELGIGFDADMEGEMDKLPLEEGEELEIHVYMNQSLYIPLDVRLVRIRENDSVRSIGAEFVEDQKGQKSGRAAFNLFLQFIDAVVDVGKLG